MWSMSIDYFILEFMRRFFACECPQFFVSGGFLHANVHVCLLVMLSLRVNTESCIDLLGSICTYRGLVIETDGKMESSWR